MLKIHAWSFFFSLNFSNFYSFLHFVAVIAEVVVVIVVAFVVVIVVILNVDYINVNLLLADILWFYCNIDSTKFVIFVEFISNYWCIIP
jgi:hypothetical protein